MWPKRLLQGNAKESVSFWLHRREIIGSRRHARLSCVATSELMSSYLQNQWSV